MNPTNTPEPTISEFLEKWLSFVFPKKSITGLTISIFHNSETLFSRAFGLRDTERSLPFTTASTIDVASHTKLLVTIALLQLSRKQAIHFDASLDTYLPELAPTQRRYPTIYELMTHQAGWARDSITDLSTTPLIDAIRIQNEQSSNKSPYHYSNFAFDTLSEVVSRASGTPFKKFARQEILQPLDMRTAHWFDERDQHDASCGYGIEVSGGRMPIPPEAPGRVGSVGLWATTDDLCRLVATFLGANEDVATFEETLPCMSVQWSNPANSNVGRSFGMGLATRVMCGERWFGHTGGAAGFVSATYANRKHGTIFSVGLNCHDIQVLESLTTCIAHALDAFVHEHDAHANTAHCSQHRLLGRYVGSTGYVEIQSTPKGTFFLDPISWNPFAGSYRLEERGDEFVVSEPNFEHGGTVLHFATDAADGTIRFGSQTFRRVE